MTTKQMKEMAQRDLQFLQQMKELKAVTELYEAKRSEIRMALYRQVDTATEGSDRKQYATWLRERGFFAAEQAFNDMRAWPELEQAIEALDATGEVTFI